MKLARFPCCAWFNTSSPFESIAGTLSTPIGQETKPPCAKCPKLPIISPILAPSTKPPFASLGIVIFATFQILTGETAFIASISLFIPSIAKFTIHSKAPITPLSIFFAIPVKPPSIVVNHCSTI